MKVLLCGIDGYLGWPLAMRLAARGHRVLGVDCFYRRHWVKEEGADSATPIKAMDVRIARFLNKYRELIRFCEGDVSDYDFMKTLLQRFKPEAIVHLAEMPSAPFSMIDFRHAWLTHINNLKTTLVLLFLMRDYCKEAHLVKVGSMGEYGTPAVDIPEGYFDKKASFKGKSLTGLLFPKSPSSWYHMAKVHDTNNIEMACRLWGLKATDIMQGVVYGTRTEEMSNVVGLDERLCTRFDYSECFGTSINRFCAQAVIGHHLTVYGSGQQKRGFLSLRDSIHCLTLAVENPPQEGEYGCRNGYRVFNQFAQVYSLFELAEKVLRAAQEVGCENDLKISHLENPRLEKEKHYYNPDHSYLYQLGYRPALTLEEELKVVLEDLMPFRERILIHQESIMPKIGFGGQIRRFDR